MPQLWIQFQDVETQDHAAACPTLPSSQKQWKFTIRAHKLQGMLIFLPQVQSLYHKLLETKSRALLQKLSRHINLTARCHQCNVLFYLNCFALKDYHDQPIDSAAVSIFVVILLNWQYLWIQPIYLQILRRQCCLSAQLFTCRRLPLRLLREVPHWVLLSWEEGCCPCPKTSSVVFKMSSKFIIKIFIRPQSY